MSVGDAVELALRALFNATYNDKYTGGTLHVYHVANRVGDDDSKIHTIHKLEAIVVYKRYYNHMDFTGRQQKTLFLLCLEHVFADDFIDHFRSLGKEVVAAHCVAKRGDFYFHRLYCDTVEVASGIYEYIRTSQNRLPPLEKFPYGVHDETNGLPYYVEKSSEDSLKYIIQKLGEKHDLKCVDLLEVYLNYYYLYYEINHCDRRTVFMASSEWLGVKGLMSIKNQLGPLGEGLETRRVAKRGNFHFYRFLFRSETDASTAYGYIQGLTRVPPPPKDLPYFRAGMYLTVKDREVAIYADKCSKELLNDICKLAPDIRPKPYTYLLKDQLIED